MSISDEIYHKVADKSEYELLGYSDAAIKSRIAKYKGKELLESFLITFFKVDYTDDEFIYLSVCYDFKLINKDKNKHECRIASKIKSPLLLKEPLLIALQNQDNPL